MVKLPVVVGIHGQIMVALCGHIAYTSWQSSPARSWARPHVLHRIGQTLHALAHLPRSGVIPLQNGDARSCSGPWCTARLHPAGRRRPGPAKKGDNSSPCIRSCASRPASRSGRLHRAIVTGQTRGTQQLFHPAGSLRAEHLQPASRTLTNNRASACRKWRNVFNQISSLRGKCSRQPQPKNTLLSVYHPAPLCQVALLRKSLCASHSSGDRKALPIAGKGLLSTIYTVKEQDQTSSRTAISAASPRRAPILMMRV